MHRRVIIVGGGLAGTYAAHLLHEAGAEVTLFEARNRLGGRILTADADGLPSADGFDLGPSWFWPDMQPGMGVLVERLGLRSFAQSSEGDVIFHRLSRETPQRYQSMPQEPQSMRLAGGTAALVSALADPLPKDSIRLNTRVTRLALTAAGVEIDLVGHERRERTTANHVVLAVPPRLLADSVAFAPELDAETIRRWRATPTWMAPHAKFFAIYGRAFWRDRGLSGSAQSMVGPLVEIHDATSASGKAALFGFVGIPAAQRAQLGERAIVDACVTQLTTLFGPDAACPDATLFKDWAHDPLTATADDQLGVGHPVADARPWITGEWSGRVALAGSETSATEPGYLAGAVAGAERAVAEVLGRTPAPDMADQPTRSEQQP